MTCCSVECEATIQNLTSRAERAEAQAEDTLRELARVSEERDSYKLTLEQCARDEG